MAEEQADQAEGAGKKKSGLVLTIAGVLALTLVGAGGGWFVGGMLAPSVQQAQADKAKEAPAAEQAGAPAAGEHGGGEKQEEDGLPRVATAANE